MTNLKNNILERINTGGVTMKPRWHFILRTIFYVSGLLLMLLITLYLVSLVFYILKETGVWWLPEFGPRGIMFFISTSPWILITFTGIFFGSVYLLFRHFGHQYRHRAVYSLVGLVLIVIGISSFMHYLALHDNLRTWTEERRVPGLQSLYSESHRKVPENIATGKIISLTADGFILEDREGTYIVVTNSQTRQPRGFTPEINKHVLVFGPKTSSSTIMAYGVRPLPPPLQKQLRNKAHLPTIGER